MYCILSWTEADLRSCAGGTWGGGYGCIQQALRNVIGRDVAAVLDIVEELVMQGRELTQLVGDFTWYLRNLLLVKTSDNIEDVLDVSTEI